MVRRPGAGAMTTPIVTETAITRNGCAIRAIPIPKGK